MNSVLATTTLASSAFVTSSPCAPSALCKMEMPHYSHHPGQSLMTDSANRLRLGSWLCVVYAEQLHRSFSRRRCMHSAHTIYLFGAAMWQSAADALAEELAPVTFSIKSSSLIRFSAVAVGAVIASRASTNVCTIVAISAATVSVGSSTDSTTGVATLHAAIRDGPMEGTDK